MKSSDLTSFSNWQKWGIRAVDIAPTQPGVYAFRLTQGMFGRIKGQSDLVYLGCTEGADRTLRQRLKAHLIHSGDTVEVGHRLKRVTGEIGGLEIAWRTTLTAVEAKLGEHGLLARYLEEHIELPPLNRKESGKAIRVVLEKLKVVAGPDPKQQAAALQKLEGKLRQRFRR